MTRHHLERLLNVRSAYQGAMGREEQLAFLTDITGTAQLWTLEAPLRWPEQKTFFSERLISVAFHPTRPLIAFTMDAGGDEQAQVYLIDAEHGPPEQISTAPDAKHLFADYATTASCFSPDGRYLVWSHNGRNGQDFDVYLYDIDAREERCVVQGSGYNMALAWTRDGRGLIVATLYSNIDNDLNLVDIETGEQQLLTPHEGSSVFVYPCPHPDGERLFFVTDVGSDIHRLACLELESGALRFLEGIEGDAWGVEQLALTDDGRVLAASYNVEGSSEVVLHDLENDQRRTFRPRSLGVLSELRAVPGAQRFTCTLTAPREPKDVWTLDALTGEMTRWTRSATAGIPLEALVEPELVRFESFDGLSVPGFFFAPPGQGPWPVVFDIHGGPESQRRPIFMAVLQYLASQGIAVYSPNVRGSAGYGKHYMALDNVRKRMDSVADLKAAYTWLVESGRAQAQRVAVFGGSYGVSWCSPP